MRQGEREVRARQGGVANRRVRVRQEGRGKRDRVTGVEICTQKLISLWKVS